MNGESNSYLTESKKSWPPCRHGGSRHSWMSSLLSCYCKLSVAMIDSILLRAPLSLPLNMSVAQKVTEAELSRHTFFTGTKNASEARKQCKKKMKKHGFILCSNRHNVPKTSVATEADLVQAQALLGKHYRAIVQVLRISV